MDVAYRFRNPGGIEVNENILLKFWSISISPRMVSVVLRGWVRFRWVFQSADPVQNVYGGAKTKHISTKEQYNLPQINFLPMLFCL